MSRPKIARKSTIVDMTAMCDVAFLLLSFFILTTKPKPSEAVPIQTPKSVANKFVPDKNLIMISLNNEGHVYLSGGDNQSDRDKRKSMLEDINQRNSLGLTPDEITSLTKAPFIGVPLNQLKQQAHLTTDQMTAKVLPGIPCVDSTNNQMTEWVRAATKAYEGVHLDLILKGDNIAKYPVFKNILTAFKKNEQFKIQMVTNQANVPQGTDLFRQSTSGKISQM